MRRFFIEEIESRDGYCVISGSEAGHISRVLRMGRGDRLILMDGKGNRFETLIESASQKEILAVIERRLPGPAPSPVEIDLCQALLKSRAMDFLIEKTSELGVDRIIPFFSERTVVTLDGERAAARVRRWKGISRAAAKQSDRIRPAEISPPVSIQELTDRFRQVNGLKVVMWEDEETRDLKELLRSSPEKQRVIGMVGPEGGFSERDIKRAREAGFISVSAGNRILRAETAAITLVAIVQYEWGDLSLI